MLGPRALVCREDLPGLDPHRPSGVMFVQHPAHHPAQEVWRLPVQQGLRQKYLNSRPKGNPLQVNSNTQCKEIKLDQGFTQGRDRLYHQYGEEKLARSIHILRYLRSAAENSGKITKKGGASSTPSLAEKAYSLICGLGSSVGSSVGSGLGSASSVGWACFAAAS